MIDALRKGLQGKRLIIAILSGLAAIPVISQILADDKTTHVQLVEDVRQLASIIESVHPDPYINGGGKIAFHRRLQKVLNNIPETGMTDDEFFLLICPFVTSIGDSHTWLKAPDDFSYGIPLYFDVVGTSLYVRGVFFDEHKSLMGGQLLAIEGVAVDEIVDRARKFVSAENEYQLHRNIGRQGMLFNNWFLERLIPETGDKKKVNIKLKHTDGKSEWHDISLPNSWESLDYKGFGSKIELPSNEKCDIVYDFIDKEKQTALLVISDMMTYREAFEMWAHDGVFHNRKELAKETYERFNSDDAPDNQEKLISGIPSATEIFSSLSRDMKEAETKNLIIDLRNNGGGNSAMSEILIYHLYGKEKLLSIEKRNLEITKYSRIFFEQNTGLDLQKINEDLGFPMTENDYSFTLDFPHNGYPSDEEIALEFLKEAKRMRTFFAEYNSGEHDGFYLPENVVVLSNPWTYSSGFSLLAYLHKAGAKIVGTPSAQAGNCFGDILSFRLNHSDLKFTVSSKYFEIFPDHPGKGKVLMPDYPMTYDRLLSYGFDTNAPILYALEIFRLGGAGKETVD